MSVTVRRTMKGAMPVAFLLILLYRCVRCGMGVEKDGEGRTYVSICPG